jgi:hypothetical protein
MKYAEKPPTMNCEAAHNHFSPRKSFPPVTNRIQFGAEYPGSRSIMTNRKNFLTLDLRSAGKSSPERGLAATLDRFAAPVLSSPGVHILPEVNAVTDGLTNLSEAHRAEPHANKLPRNRFLKPTGEVGRSSRRGFSLRRALGWEDGFYNEIMVEYSRVYGFSFL